MSDDTPYNGTVEGEPFTNSSGPTTEYYRLPLKQKNEISVKASSNASILLFDGRKSSDASDIKVEVVLGTDNDSNVSIGLAKDDRRGKYALELLEKKSVLSATRFRTFKVRWVKARVMIYND
jgi:hypothetical protein